MLGQQLFSSCVDTLPISFSQTVAPHLSGLSASATSITTQKRYLGSLREQTGRGRRKGEEAADDGAILDLSMSSACVCPRKRVEATESTSPRG